MSEAIKCFSSWVLLVSCVQLEYQVLELNLMHDEEEIAIEIRMNETCHPAWSASEPYMHPS
jgi:hypothetical protein